MPQVHFKQTKTNSLIIHNKFPWETNISSKSSLSKYKFCKTLKSKTTDMIKKLIYDRKNTERKKNSAP